MPDEKRSRGKDKTAGVGAPLRGKQNCVIRSKRKEVKKKRKINREEMSAIVARSFWAKPGRRQRDKAFFFLIFFL